MIVLITYVPIAQPVEHLTFNQRVASSNLAGHTNKSAKFRKSKNKN